MSLLDSRPEAPSFLGRSQLLSTGADNRTPQLLQAGARCSERLTLLEAGRVRLGCSTGQVQSQETHPTRHKPEGPTSHPPLKSPTTGPESSNFRLGCPSSPRSLFAHDGRSLLCLSLRALTWVQCLAEPRSHAQHPSCELFSGIRLQKHRETA